MRLIVFGLFLALFDVIAAPALSQSFWERTHLVSVHDDGNLSSVAQKLGRGGYELSGGQAIRFGGWYDSNWRDIHVTFLTEIKTDFGILWGFSTGEAGEKYRIDPSLKFGVIMQKQFGKSGTLSFSFKTSVFGHLQEKNCVADYGVISGPQTVNCRLAASPLPPAETLGYTLNEAPSDRLLVTLKYQVLF
ncbi:hypothetical protein J5Y17_01575 [Celeribacter sp. PS-C1]|nr:hypothetical protein [Celeribacter sp. PS-C1]